MTLTSLRKFALVLLFTTAIFEPSDRVFGLKVPLFTLFILLGIIALLIGDGFSMPSFAQLLYVCTFALLFPLWGLAVSVVFNPTNLGTDGLQYFKSHLFLIFSLFLAPLALLRFGEKTFIRLLVILAHVIIGLFVISLVVPPTIYSGILIFGRQTNLFLLGGREYAGVFFPTVYYVTAPLLVFSVAYYLERATRQLDRTTSYLAIVSTVGLFLSGTRNAILMSLLIPAFYFMLQRRGRLVLVFALPALLVLGAGVLESMFDPKDVSNSAKLAYLPDYSAILAEPKNLLLGQGLGARFFAHGLGEIVSITELSYFEAVRTYGIVIALAFVAYLIYPLVLLARTRDRTCYLTVGYAAYLVQSYSNPYLMSSNGMLVLGLVAAIAFQFKGQQPAPSV